MINPTDGEDTELTLIEIKNSLRDIELKLDHLIRTYHKRFFAIGDQDRELGLDN